MTQPQLEKLSKLWMRRLRLQDWVVTVKLVEDEEKFAGMQGSLGVTYHDPSECKADIGILDEGSNIAMEATLIHELLHLRLVPFDGKNHNEKEQAINLLADCFLRAYPKRKKK